MNNPYKLSMADKAGDGGMMQPKARVVNILNVRRWALGVGSTYTCLCLSEHPMPGNYLMCVKWIECLVKPMSDGTANHTMSCTGDGLESVVLVTNVCIASG